MRHQNSVFHQILQFVPWAGFKALVDHHGADARVRHLTTKSQFVALLGGQLSGASSLRDIEATLHSHEQRLFHLGVKAPARSTLADANAKRPAAVFADLFSVVLKQSRPAARRHAREAIHVLDATSIRLCAQSKHWANYEPHDAMVKVHVSYHPEEDIPTRFEVTPARLNDITVAKAQALEPGATYVFDLGYYDFTWFSEINAAGCRFVTRLKTHTRPRVVREFPVAPGGPVKADRHIRIDGRLKSARGRRHPLHATTLREVEVTIDTGKTLRLLTNDLNASADEIANLYKARWRIELFFRWIKQHLKIKRFLGVSENAIRVQIAVALIAYLLLKIAHQAQTKVPSLLTFARLIRANLMHLRLLCELDKPPPPKEPDPCQPELALC